MTDPDVAARLLAVKEKIASAQRPAERRTIEQLVRFIGDLEGWDIDVVHMGDTDLVDALKGLLRR